MSGSSSYSASAGRARRRPVLVFDGDCGFCTRCAEFARLRLRLGADVVPAQRADLAVLGVTAARAAHEVLWVTPPGTVYGGAAAVAKVLMRAGGPWAPLGAVLTLPGVRVLARAAYRLVADHRGRLPGGTGTCGVPGAGGPGGAP